MGSFIRTGPGIEEGERSSCGVPRGAWSRVVYLLKYVVTLRTRIPKLTTAHMCVTLPCVTHGICILNLDTFDTDTFEHTRVPVYDGFF